MIDAECEIASMFMSMFVSMFMRGWERSTVVVQSTQVKRASPDICAERFLNSAWIQPEFGPDSA